MNTKRCPWAFGVLILGLLTGGCGMTPPHQLYEPRYENPQTPVDDPHFVAARAAREALPHAVTLHGVVTLAALNSPMTSVAWYRMSAARELRSQRTALPDPKLEARYFFHRGDANWMLMLSQEIPFPTKLLLEGDQADREALAAALRYDLAVRDAIAEAKMAYTELYYIDRAQVVTAALETLYQRYAALAAGDAGAAAAPGTAGPAAPADDPMPGDPPAAPAPKLPELFRAQSQLAQARFDRALLQEMRANQEQQLLATLGLPPDTQLGPTEDLRPPPAVGVTLPELRQRAAATNQELAVLAVEKERADLAVTAAAHAPLPDLMLGVTYEDMKMLPTDKDPIGLSVGLSLPLWWGNYSARRRETAQMARAMGAEQKGALFKLNADLAQAYFRLQNSSRLVRLYEDNLLPQARQALRSAEEQHRLGNTSLLALLEATAAMQNFELAHLRATADYYLNVARIEQLVGAPLTSQPPTESAPPIDLLQPLPTHPEEPQP